MKIAKNSYPVFFLILIVSSIYSRQTQNNHPLDARLRNLFYASVESEDSLEVLKKLVDENISDTTKGALITAYSAGARALEGKHAFWPFTKLSKINESMDIFEKAIGADSLNLEIRFMRFSILHHLPGILGYNQEKKDDAAVIVDLLVKKDYSQLDYNVQEGIVKFMVESGRLTTGQMKKLESNFSFLAKNE